MQAQCTDTDRIRRHFSFIRDFDITLRDMNEIAYQSNAFRLEEYDGIREKPDTIINREQFLKTLLRKDNSSSSAFLEELQNRGFIELYKVIICSNENHIEAEAVHGNVYQHITRSDLQQNFEFVYRNLEIAVVLDMLFERGIISINEHDEIQQKETRSQKRECLLQMLLSRRDACWLSSFITTLRLTGHDTLLEQLSTLAQQVSIRPVAFRLGHTAVIPTDFIARLSSHSSTSGQLRSIVEADYTVIQDCMDAGLIEIWEGSIYFHLSTSSPQKMLSILNGDDDEKLKACLQQLFSGNKGLLLHFSKDTVIQFELEEKPNDVFITRGYGKYRKGIVQSSAYYTDHCSECYQSTLRENYNIVLDEIEDDIIQDTIHKLEEARLKHSFKYETKGCLLKHKTRTEKAATFLQYVLCNEDALQQFRSVFSYRSQVVLNPHKCSTCSGKTDELVPYKSSRRVLYFTLSLDELSTVQIKIVDSNMQLPSILFRTVVQNPDSQPERAVSMVDIPLKKVSDEYRIVVIGQTKWRAEFFTCAKKTQEKTLKFYELPGFQQNRKKLADKDKEQKIARCIAGSSPGPHAFLYLIDLRSETINISLEPYLQFFGDDFMDFLILMFIVKDNLPLAEDLVEKSSHLQRTLNQCSHRYVIFPARLTDDVKRMQIKKLVRHVEQILIQTDRPYYSSTMFEKSETEVQRTMKVIESQKMTTIQILQKEIQNIKVLDPRHKAAEKLISQDSFIEMVNERM